MTMDNVRLAGAEDLQALSFVLLKMMNDQGLATPVSGDQLAATLAQDGPGGNGLFDCLIAFHRMRPSGFLMFTPAYDLCSLSRYVQVHHLYISDQARGNGLRADMLAFLAQLALEQGWSHVDWLVPRTDLDTITCFQKSLGLPCEHSGFRMNRANLLELARAQAA